MAVAVVSTDTVRSSLGPAATPVTVSVTATLLLAELALTDGAARTAGRRLLGRLQRIICGRSKFPRPHHLPDQLLKRRVRTGGPPNRPELAEPRPLVSPEAGQRPAGNGLNGVRATCGPSRGKEGAHTKPGEHLGQ